MVKDVGIGYFDMVFWYGFGRFECVMGDVLWRFNYILLDKVGCLLCLGLVEDLLVFGMIDFLLFYVVYDYSYDGFMWGFEDNL